MQERHGTAQENEKSDATRLEIATKFKASSLRTLWKVSLSFSLECVSAAPAALAASVNEVLGHSVFACANSWWVEPLRLATMASRLGQNRRIQELPTSYSRCRQYHRRTRSKLLSLGLSSLPRTTLDSLSTSQLLQQGIEHTGIFGSRPPLHLRLVVSVVQQRPSAQRKFGCPSCISKGSQVSLVQMK
jgi:hypothetical protein